MGYISESWGLNWCLFCYYLQIQQKYKNDVLTPLCSYETHNSLKMVHSFYFVTQQSGVVFSSSNKSTQCICCALLLDKDLMDLVSIYMVYVG